MNNKIIWGVVVVVITGIIGYVVYTGNADDPTTIPTDTEYIDEEVNVAPDSGITADDILENPERYEGADVTLRAEVEEWLNPRAFTLDAPGIVQDNLLIVTRDPTYVYEDPELFGDAIWEVQGTVERFQLATVIDTYEADLQADAFALYEGRPFVVADSVILFED